MKHLLSRLRQYLSNLFRPQVSQSVEADRTKNTSITQTANIFNFFTVSLVLASFLTVGVLLALRAYQNSQYNLRPMAGNLNVAVVRFTDWSDGKCGVDDRSGALIANAFYSRLEQDRSEEDLYRSSNILMELRSPDELSPVKGRNEEELLHAVEALAVKINAHIVVYGSLTCSPITQNPTYELMFYVAPSSVSDAQELIGEFSFRADVLHGEINSGKEFITLNKSLQQKIEVLSILVKAIGSFWGDDYERSLGYLEAALNSTLWEKESGKEVIHIIAGNCESRYAQYLLVNGKDAEALAAIERARSDYRSADELTHADGRGDYGRAFIGLAGVESFYAWQTSLLTNDLQDIDLAALEREKTLLEAAEKALYNPPTSDIPEKVAFNRAQIELLSFQLNRAAADLASARADYQFVIDSYQQGNIRVREMAGHSYVGLAIIERIGKQIETAIENYQKAIKITRVPSLQAQYILQIGNTYYADGQPENALKYYQETLDRKQDLENRVPPATISDLEKRVEEIKQALSNTSP
jgi:hypothetical protein